jgi:NADH-quinone oxidoreductase subunit A
MSLPAIAPAADTIHVLTPLIIFMGIAIALFGGALLVAYLISPKAPSRLKSTPYECGEVPVGSAWSMFNVRFYVIGLVFIIFDVETALLIPVASVYKSLVANGQGTYAFIILLAFMAIIVEGLAYLWKKGDLDWVKSFKQK